MALRRLHLGVGNAYIKGYTNIDLYIPGYSFLASERPDLVKKNRTTLDRYYKNSYPSQPQDFECVADRFADITTLDYPEDSIHEIICIQTFEHLSRQEASQALTCWHKILKPGGRLLIDVPDFEKLILLYLAQRTEVDREWHYRMIFGSQKNEGAFHKDGYSLCKLYEMLEAHGFKNIRVRNNGHPYPAIVMEASKSKLAL